MTPHRVQRRRAKGSRTPAGTVNVDRSSRWGNPFTVEDHGRDEAIRLYTEWILHSDQVKDGRVRRDPVQLRSELPTLAGKDLACFCGLGEACHADVLLTLANRGHKETP